MNTYLLTIVKGKTASQLKIKAQNSGQAKAKVSPHVIHDTIYVELVLRANKGSHF